MTFEIVFVLALVALVMALWAFEVWPLDQVALCIPVVLAFSGILDPREAFSGFASTPVITIAAIFVLSGSLVQTGAVTFVGERIIRWSKGDERRLLLLVMLTMLAFSAFINNTAIVAMFLPVILSVSHRFDVASSKLLIPLSYASILGGTCTLIGTSTNLLVHGLLMQEGLEGLTMFEISRLGLILAAVGIGYIYFFGVRLLPERGTGTRRSRTPRGANEYITEVQVPRGSEVEGMRVSTVLEETFPDVEIKHVNRGEELLFPPFEEKTLQEGDILRLEGDVNELLEIYKGPEMVLLPRLQEEIDLRQIRDMALAEVVILPNSRLTGRTLDQIDFRRRFGVSVMALQRHGEQLRERITEIELQNGDILLVTGESEDVAELSEMEEFVVLQGVQEVLVNKERAPVAVALVVAFVIAASLGVAPVMVLAVTAALALIGCGCLSIEQAYRSIDVSVLMLIGGAMALGQAMESSGAAHYLADGVVASIGHLGPYAVLAATYLLTNLLTETMTNNAAAVLMVPLAVSMAGGMGLDPRPFAIAVAFAGSASFATPVGYQTNLLVYGAAKYRFLDFTRVGLPLNLMLWALATLLIPYFWPF